VTKGSLYDSQFTTAHVQEDDIERTVSTVGINGLEQPQHNPEVHSDYVEVSSKNTVKYGTSQGSESEDEYLCRVSILGCQTERGRILVMNFVDILVKDTTVESLVGYFVERGDVDEYGEMNGAVSKTYQGSGKSPQRRKRKRLEERRPSMTGRVPAR
jgi:hypothetical protein